MKTFLEENSEEIKNTLNFLASNIADSIDKKLEGKKKAPNFEHVIYENLVEPFRAIIKKYGLKVDEEKYTISDASELKVILDNLVDCFNNSVINGIGEFIKNEKELTALTDKIKNVSYLYINDIENIFRKYISSEVEENYISYNCDFRGINNFLENVANGKIIKKGNVHVYVDSNDKEYVLASKEVIENNVKCQYVNGKDIVNIDIDLTKNSEGKLVKFINKYVYKDKYILVIGVPSSFVINLIDKDAEEYVYVCKSIANSQFIIDIRNVSFTEEKYKEIDEDKHAEYALDILKKKFKNIYKALMNDVDFEILVNNINDGKKLDEKDEIIKDLRKQLKEKNKIIKELKAQLKDN